MIKRRQFLKFGLATAGTGMLASKEASAELLPPENLVPSVVSKPSPPATPYATPLYRMPVATPIPVDALDPAPDPNRHQRWDEFVPQKHYVERLREFKWEYHPDPPYDQGSWSWGFADNDGTMTATPGPTYHAYYGEPVFVRRINELPDIGDSVVRFALPSSTIHLHNAHTASESDGIPVDYTNPGEFWDHHYCNFPAGFDDDERLHTLWYHDHRLDFTGPNVYAGLTGFYCLFDEQDSNDENDMNPEAWRLPSGEYDVPLVFHDVQFDENGQVVWDFFDANPVFTTVNGMLGDMMTVNRKIMPFFEVEPRKYRFRMLNGGPSRFYEFKLRPQEGTNGSDTFTVLTSDGNFLEEPVDVKQLVIAVAQRHDVVIDFSGYNPGDTVELVNVMDMRDDGAGPSGRMLMGDDALKVMQFKVKELSAPDNSQIPARFRDLPNIDMSEVRRERLFVFDYDNGLWTINGKLMDPNRIDAKIERGSAEIWTFRNAGQAWSHPIHSHFEEFQILEVDGVPLAQDDLRRTKMDVVHLGPNQEIRFFCRWRDFLGKHVQHCHNVVHEDHAMMIRWDIVPPGFGD